MSDGVTGFLFKAGDNNDLEKCLIKVLNLSFEERRTLLLNALEEIKSNRIWLKNAEKYALVYEKLQVGSSEKVSRA